MEAKTQKRLRPFEDIPNTRYLKHKNSEPELLKPDPFRPLDVFEFPWKGLVVASSESDGWDLRDVFFRSLVDGCSAKIGLPGDRLGWAPAPFPLLSDDGSWPTSNEEINDMDCVWRSVLWPVLAAEKSSREE